jgi:hypothetical protein
MCVAEARCINISVLKLTLSSLNDEIMHNVLVAWEAVGPVTGTGEVAKIKTPIIAPARN